MIDEEGKIEGGFNRFTMAAINPHTTQREGRTCKDCHATPKTVGLGTGTVWKEDGQWHLPGSLRTGYQTLKFRLMARNSSARREKS